MPVVGGRLGYAGQRGGAPQCMPSGSTRAGLRPVNLVPPMHGVFQRGAIAPAKCGAGNNVKTVKPNLRLSLRISWSRFLGKPDDVL
jgi:hypothetical protein